MRIQEILIESHQLDEGPILNKIGSAVGKGVGALAKGVGAVAGGVAGLGAAAKKGFQAGKATVASAGDDADPAAGGAAAGGAAAGGAAAGGAAAGGKPAAGSGGTSTKPKGFLAGVKAGQSQGLSAFNDPNVVGSSTPAGGAPAADDEDPAPAAGATTPPSATDINKAGPKGTAQAKPVQGTVAKQAAAKTGAALAGQDQGQAGQTMYTQVKANIDKLDKKGKQRILQLLQKSMAAPEAKPAAAPGAMGQMAGQLAKGGAAAPNTMANAPVSKTNTAKPGNPNAAAPTGNYDGNTGEPISDKGKADAAAMAAFKASPKGQAQQAKWDAEDAAAAGGAPAAEQPAPTKKRTTKKAQPEMAGKINTGSMVLEGFSLFRKK